ncbi:hypothetical protein BIT28_23420 [Photobacterium proteolyticum]|uniref:Uncharacterized protein n=2 Tax=Photobacterium proteolyticum TaxID=1903952 RepID=A0A1Q9H1Z1_9GAMM|nr:hypothetical protein BIT28_23420 [Photobacterium proteolyticum]
MSVSNDYLLHAANITANYLDNNQDGNWDDDRVTNHLSNVGASLFILKNEDESYMMDLLSRLPSNVATKFADDSSSQALYESEMVLCDSSHSTFSSCFNQNDKRDPSYEEILHLITHVGYAQVHPSTFSEDENYNSLSGSGVGRANDLARDDVAKNLTSANQCVTDTVTTPFGNFVEYDCNWDYSAHPNAWYTYTDPTCDYSCMVTEYTYWTINAALGMLEHLDGNTSYSEEYKCLTRNAFTSGGICANDIGLEAIYGTGAKINASNELEAPNNTFHVPTQIPFGNYSPNGSKMDWSISYVTN